MARLHLQGPQHAWSDTALAGTLGEGEDRRPVLVFLGPDPGGDTPNPRERKAAWSWVGRESAGVHPLLDVIPYKNRNAWVHPASAALGLIHLVDVPHDQRPPIRVAAEVVAAIADTLVALGPDGLVHPGPQPEDVAVDTDGQIRILGFASPWPRSPLFRDPSGAEDSQAAVWRLGVLLALLLGGRIPAVNNRTAHEAMVRRVLIRAMSRSGPIFSERYRDWLSGMLAWDPDQRPALSAVASGLREVAAKIDGPDLPTWAGTEVDRLREEILERAEMLGSTIDTDVSYHPWLIEPDPSEDVTAHPDDAAPKHVRTLPGVPLSALSDDETAETTLYNGENKLPVPVMEPGTMPVGIGPPVEEMQKRPTIPRDFFEEPEQAPAAAPRVTDVVQVALMGLLMAVMLGLAGLVGLVLWIGF